MKDLQAKKTSLILMMTAHQHSGEKKNLMTNK